MLQCFHVLLLDGIWERVSSVIVYWLVNYVQCLICINYSIQGICTGIVCLIIGMLVDMWIFVINGSTLDKHLEKQKKRQKNNSKLLPNYSGLVKYD